MIAPQGYEIGGNAGLEPPAGARNRMKATVKMPGISFFYMIPLYNHLKVTFLFDTIYLSLLPWQILIAKAERELA